MLSPFFAFGGRSSSGLSGRDALGRSRPEGRRTRLENLKNAQVIRCITDCRPILLGDLAVQIGYERVARVGVSHDILLAESMKLRSAPPPAHRRNGQLSVLQSYTQRR
jgi:hypothetical protein